MYEKPHVTLNGQDLSFRQYSRHYLELNNHFSLNHGETFIPIRSLCFSATNEKC